MALGESKSVKEGLRERAHLKATKRADLRAKARKLRQEGLQHSAILHRLGVSSTQLYKLLKG